MPGEFVSGTNFEFVKFCSAPLLGFFKTISHQPLPPSWDTSTTIIIIVTAGPRLVWPRVTSTYLLEKVIIFVAHRGPQLTFLRK